MWSLAMVAIVPRVGPSTPAVSAARTVWVPGKGGNSPSTTSSVPLRGRSSAECAQILEYSILQNWNVLIQTKLNQR